MGNFIGPSPVRSYAPISVKDDFSGNGSATAFDLSRDVAAGGDNSLLVVVGTTIMEPGVDYTLGNDGSGNPRRITFTSAPASGTNNIYVIQRDRETGKFTPDDTSVGNSQLAATAITGQALVTADNADHVLVSDASDSGALKKALVSTIGNDVANGGNNRILTDTGTGGSLNAEANATFDGSTLSVTGAITASGVVTGAGFTIGSAVIAEAELEMLDGITAGTAAASKALVVDANKDIGTLRNLTIDGTFSDGNYTFDTSGNVSGLGTVGSGAITSSASVTAGTSFIIGSADINETDLEKLDGITNGTAAANKALVADANIDIGTIRNLTMTGDLTVGGTTALDDNILEINRGATSNANDCGIIIERGSTGDNAAIIWDESSDQFVLGTTTSTGTATGNLTVAASPLSISTLSATEVSMADSQKLKLGAGNDLEIYHNGSNSIINDTGTGDLILAGEEVQVLNSAMNETKAVFTTNGSVDLYYDNVKKVETTSAGATITGTLTISALPTSDPTSAGALWNSSGTVKVSAG